MSPRGASTRGARQRSGSDEREPPERSGAALAPLEAEAVEFPFTIAELGALRRLVSRAARSASLSVERSEDLTLAVNELAANSVRHGGGRGTLLMWRDDAALVCEVRDSGHIAEPWLRRVRPGYDPHNGRGLWLVDQLCDLVQIHSSLRTGSAVRVHVWLPTSAS